MNKDDQKKLQDIKSRCKFKENKKKSGDPRHTATFSHWYPFPIRDTHSGKYQYKNNHIYIYIYIYIYIINKSCWQHRFPWLFFSICPYNPSFPKGLPNGILCQHGAGINKILLVSQQWRVVVKGFIEERHLWVHPWFFSRVPLVLFILLGLFVRWEASGRVGVYRRTSFIRSSVLLQHCTACLVRVTWMVYEMGGKWPCRGL